MSITETARPAVRHLWITVRVFNVATGDEIRSHRRDWLDPDTKNWLIKLGTWALNNAAAVEIVNAKDDK